ncbi:MAG: hypothetical protein LBT62_04750 [Deltaproteobacteria bacterium]|nr:hypothetical protein [Deltaproteobacteria bacterium]
MTHTSVRPTGTSTLPPPSSSVEDFELGNPLNQHRQIAYQEVPLYRVFPLYENRMRIQFRLHDSEGLLDAPQIFINVLNGNIWVYG